MNVLILTKATECSQTMWNKHAETTLLKTTDYKIEVSSSQF